MLTATSVVAFNDIVRDIKQLPLSSMDSIDRIDAAIDALQEDIKEHLKAALSSIGDRIQSLKKRKEPSAVTQAEARRAIRDLARLKRLVTGVDGGHPRDALAILGVVPSEDNDPTASICPVCMERRATRVVLGSCGHAVCAKCVISNPVAKCPVCRGSISFVLRVF
ncbi:g9538 [Coccomyxa viridis]